MVLYRIDKSCIMTYFCARDTRNCAMENERGTCTFFNQAIYSRSDRCNRRLTPKHLLSLSPMQYHGTSGGSRNGHLSHFRFRHRWRLLWARTGGWYKHHWRALDRLVLQTSLFQLFRHSPSMDGFPTLRWTALRRFHVGHPPVCLFVLFGPLLGDKRRSHRHGFGQSCRTTYQKRPCPQPRGATHPSLQLVDQRAQPHRTLHLEAGGPRPRLTPGCGHCNPKPLCLSATPAWIVDPMRFRLTWRGPSEQAAVSRRCHKLHRKIKTLGKITNALTDTSCQTLIVWRCPACGNLVFSRSSRLRALFVSFSLFFVLLFFSSLSLSLHASLLHKGSGSRVNVCPRPCLSTLSMGQARNPLTSLTTLCA